MVPLFLFNGSVCAPLSPCLGIATNVPVGTGIQLFGNVTSVTYDLSLDGQTNSSISSFSSDPTLLASYSQLSDAQHMLSLRVHNPNNSTSSLMVIDKAVITIPTELQKCVCLALRLCRTTDVHQPCFQRYREVQCSRRHEPCLYG